MGWAISRVLNWSFEIRNVAKLSSFFVYTRTIRVSTFSCTMACPHSCKCTVYGLFLEFLLVKGCALLLFAAQLSQLLEFCGANVCNSASEMASYRSSWVGTWICCLASIGIWIVRRPFSLCSPPPSFFLSSDSSTFTRTCLQVNGRKLVSL